MIALERFAFLKWDDFKDITQPLFPSWMMFASNFIWGQIGKGTKKASPYKTLSQENLGKKCLDTMKPLSDWLGTKRYFFGEENLTILDIIVFGMTTQVFQMSPDKSEVKKNVQTLGNLVQHNKTIKEVIFSDWDDLLHKEA